MDQHTSAAKNWLDRRYSRGADGRYKAHQPIRGLSTEFAEPNALVRLARTFKLLEWMHTLEFESVLDIGGGEGYLSALIRDLFDSKVVCTCDLSVEANLRAGELFGIGGVSADASRLPFADGSYDLVVCSEVIEHLSRPALAIGEAMRVARKYVIVSTAEFSPLGEFERKLRVLTLDRSYPHAELNWFTADDFALLMGANTVMSPQYKGVAHRLPVEDRARDAVERTLVFLTDVQQVGVDRTGVIAVHAKDGTIVEPRRLDATELRRTIDRLLDGPSMHEAAPPPAGVDPELASRLRCVSCGGRVPHQDAGSSLTCEDCGTTYLIKTGVPVMLTDDAAAPSQAAREAQCASRLAGADAERRARILGLMARLHDSRAGRHGATVHMLAEQSLRILWLFGRSEPWSSTLRRVTRRLFGQVDSGEAAMLARLAARPAETSGVAQEAAGPRRP